MVAARDTPQPGTGPGYSRVAVLGAGAWGTALAATARRSDAEVVLWGRDEAVAAAISRTRENPAYLPGIRLPAGIAATTDLHHAISGAKAVILVVPSQAIRKVARQIAGLLPDGIPVAICAKGIEAETGKLMSQVAKAELGPRPIGAISGPTFAREVAQDHPTAATIAFPFRPPDLENPMTSTAVRFALTLSAGAFRPYISDDVIGVEIGGTVKNVIAIACGMMAGAGFAENTRAALISRGIEEMQALAVALGGRRETVTGLSGVGDLTLTCSSRTSRNMSLGFQLGRGTPRAECFGGKPVVVEGEVNSRSVVELARKSNVTMPISNAVHAVLHQGASIGDIFTKLWTRPIRGELQGQAFTIDNPAATAAAARMRGNLP